MKKLVICLIASLMLLFVTDGFCGERDGITDDKISIGVITIFTGPSADVGEAGKRGATLATEEINEAGGIHGRKIEIIFDDSAYQPAKAVAAAKKQIHGDKVFCIVGPCGSHTASAIMPFCEEAKIPMIENCGLTKDISDPFRKYVFQSMLTTDLDSYIVWKYAVENIKPKPKTAAILTYKGAYGQSKIEDDKKNIENFGLKLVADEWCQWGDIDYTTQILKIKEANPDVFMLNVFAQWSGKIITQWKGYGMKAPIVGGNLLYMGLLFDTGGPGIEGTICGTIVKSQDDPKLKWFMDKFRKRFPDAPRDLGTVTQLTYGALQSVFEALRRSGKDVTRTKFIEALESLRDFDPKVLAPISYFPDDHRAFRLGYIYKFNSKGERIPVTEIPYQLPPLKVGPKK